MQPPPPSTCRCPGARLQQGPAPQRPRVRAHLCPRGSVCRVWARARARAASEPPPCGLTSHAARSRTHPRVPARRHARRCVLCRYAAFSGINPEGKAGLPEYRDDSTGLNLAFYPSVSQGAGAAGVWGPGFRMADARQQAVRCCALLPAIQRCLRIGRPHTSVKLHVTEPGSSARGVSAAAAAGLSTRWLPVLPAVLAAQSLEHCARHGTSCHTRRPVQQPG